MFCMIQWWLLRVAAARETKTGALLLCNDIGKRRFQTLKRPNVEERIIIKADEPDLHCSRVLYWVDGQKLRLGKQARENSCLPRLRGQISQILWPGWRRYNAKRSAVSDTQSDVGTQAARNFLKSLELDCVLRATRQKDLHHSNEYYNAKRLHMGLSKSYIGLNVKLRCQPSCEFTG